MTPHAAANGSTPLAEPAFRVSAVRLAAVAAAAVAVGVLAVGCTDGSSQAEAAAEAALHRVEEAGTVAVEVGVEVPSEAGIPDIELTTEVDYRGAEPDVRMYGSMGDRIDMRVVDGTIYMMIAGDPAEEERPWWRLDADDIPENHSLHSRLEELTSGGLVTFPLDMLADAGADVEAEPDRVGGEPVMKYTFETPGSDFAANTGLGALPLEAVDAPLPQAVWINRDDVLVRYELDVTPALGDEAPTGFEMVAVYRFARWGDPLRIEAPPARLVSDRPPEGL